MATKRFSNGPSMACLTTLLVVVAWTPTEAQEAGVEKPPTVPKVWDEKAIAAIELPLPHEDFSPVHVPADYYYRIPVRLIYKSYPIYVPGKTPRIDGEDCDDRAYVD